MEGVHQDLPRPQALPQQRQLRELRATIERKINKITVISFATTNFANKLFSLDLVRLQFSLIINYFLLHESKNFIKLQNYKVIMPLEKGFESMVSGLGKNNFQL